MPHPPGSLTDRLAEHLSAGTVLDLIPDRAADTSLDEAEMRSWDAGHDIDSDVLRELLLGRVVDDPDPRGLRIRGGRIRGRLDLDQLDTAITLVLQDCLLDHGITAEQAHLPALALNRCRLSHPTKPAILADELRIDTSLSLMGSTFPETVDGTIRLLGAHIGGRLDCRGATVRNATGPALAADNLQTGGDVFLSEGFTADSASEDGTIRLPDAHIGGCLNCRGAAVRNTTGPALIADNLQTGSDVLLSEGFTADSASEDGTIVLLCAHIAGQLSCRGATVRNTTGPALVADGLQTGSDVFLDEDFTADGTSEDGTIRLPGAHIGQLSCRGATVRNTTGPALVADNLTGGDVFLDKGFTADGASNRGTIRLLGAHIGQLFLGATVTSRSDPSHRLQLDGLTYTSVPSLGPATRDAWLALLRTATPAYAAQPYQQLAAGYRAQGHDSDVRAILIAQRRDQLARGALTRRGDRWWARLTGLLLGYGYQPWRALVYLAGVLAASVVLAVVLGDHGALARTPDPAPAPVTAAVVQPSQPCTLVQSIGRGLDLGAPFLPPSRSGSGSCEIATDSATGEALTISRWILQLAAWALAALFIAGFTGIVRKL